VVIVISTGLFSVGRLVCAFKKGYYFLEASKLKFMEKNEQQKHPERNCKETNITKEM
jgi:hypothetical protein